MFSSSFFFFALSSKICLIRNVELSDDVTPNGLKEAASSAYGKKDFEAVLLQLLAGPIIGERMSSISPANPYFMWLLRERTAVLT